MDNQKKDSLKELTQEEADRLIAMLKATLDESFTLPHAGERSKEFRVKGEGKHDIFTVSVFSGSINPHKRNFGARISANGTVLLELHLNPTSKHINPDGKVIAGSHWHIYREGYGRQYAFPAEDGIDEGSFAKCLIRFLDRFNVTEKPRIMADHELF